MNIEWSNLRQWRFDRERAQGELGFAKQQKRNIVFSVQCECCRCRWRRWDFPCTLCDRFLLFAQSHKRQRNDSIEESHKEFGVDSFIDSMHVFSIIFHSIESLRLCVFIVDALNARVRLIEIDICTSNPIIGGVHHLAHHKNVFETQWTVE